MVWSLKLQDFKKEEFSFVNISYEIVKHEQFQDDF